MSRGPENDDTFHTVEGRYQKWNDANPRPRSASAIKVPEMSDAMEKTVGMALGFGAGVVLLLLAVFTALNAAKWGAVDRSGAQVAYTIAAFFLTLAGVGALAATYNHVFRIIPGEDPHHH
ncbi:MAG TPA: phage holin family protein [Longimicrobium sp.]|nr:phage holin family protein [Longimicrobium sp.]